VDSRQRRLPTYDHADILTIIGGNALAVAQAWENPQISAAEPSGVAMGGLSFSATSGGSTRSVPRAGRAI